MQIGIDSFAAAYDDRRTVWLPFMRSPQPCTKASHRLGRRRFVRPAPTDGPFARQNCARFTASTSDRPDMWTQAYANKRARVSQLPASLSTKRTAAFASALRARARRRLEYSSSEKVEKCWFACVCITA